jgi:hypothetical protein
MMNEFTQEKSTLRHQAVCTVVALVVLIAMFGCATAHLTADIKSPVTGAQDKALFALTIATTNDTFLAGEKIAVSLQLENVSGEPLSINEPYYGDETWLVDGREASLPVPAKAEIMPRRTFLQGQRVCYVRHVYWSDCAQLHYREDWAGGQGPRPGPLASPGVHTVKVRIRLCRLILGKPGVIESNEIKITRKKSP